MILTAEDPATNLYRIEVSGWDENKAFFVENAELKWTEESDKQVTLSCRLGDGAVVFLRLLQPISNDRSHPVAYEAELVARTDEGLRLFRLRPVSARAECRTELFRQSGSAGAVECRNGTAARNGGAIKQR